ncbi:MAG TPA: PPC domain-containing DNA-binding protein [Candidatus Saccharimonas sp.]|nr:PPC domain-containing DNA-binding protein [Candidatus Saccharimonas sp.]
MRYQADTDAYNFTFTLQKGERWADAFAAFTKKTGVDSAWLSIIGGTAEVTLGYYNLDTKQYQWQTFAGLREITGVQGNIARDQNGTIMAHLHGTFGDADYQLIGGHVKDFVAGATVEVFVHRFDTPLKRAQNTDIGLQLLDLQDDNANA